jgi:phosphatidylglycerol---prolipoprotein diacylglyceryl transferase
MPSREAFRIGDLVVHWYGIMIMLGVVAASFIAYQEAKRRREDPDHVWGLFPWVLLFGIIGARIGWVVASIGSLSTEPLTINFFGVSTTLPSWARIFAIWEGGISIHGAVVGGALAVWGYARRNNISFFRWADIISPGLALAQAIGRWGNYFNQEAFGSPTTLPWGIPISVDRQQAVAGQVYGENVRFHPTFAYEMIWDLLNFGLLMWLGRQKRLRLREGDVFWVYLIFYSVGRYLIEELRVDSATVGTFKTPQLISIVLIVLALVMLVLRNRPGSTAPYSPENLPDSEREALEAASARRTRTSARRASRIRRVPATSVQSEPDSVLTGTDTP